MLTLAVWLECVHHFLSVQHGSKGGLGEGIFIDVYF